MLKTFTTILEQKVIICFVVNDYDIGMIIIRNGVLLNFIHLGNKNITNFAILEKIHLTPGNK